MSLKVLRGVAALAVTFVHIQEQLVHRYGVAGALPDLSLGFAGVDLFFVISGFIMVYTSERLLAVRCPKAIFPAPPGADRTALLADIGCPARLHSCIVP